MHKKWSGLTLTIFFRTIDNLVHDLLIFHVNSWFPAGLSRYYNYSYAPAYVKQLPRSHLPFFNQIHRAQLQ
jgi:hypothetical protein